jgi:hypothetical protein
MNLRVRRYFSRLFLTQKTYKTTISTDSTLFSFTFNFNQNLFLVHCLPFHIHHLRVCTYIYHNSPICLFLFFFFKTHITCYLLYLPPDSYPNQDFLRILFTLLSFFHIIVIYVTIVENDPLLYER